MAADRPAATAAAAAARAMHQRYRSALAANPSDAVLRHDFAAFLAASGDPGAAVRELERVVAAEPGRTASLSLLALCLRGAGDPSRALAVATALLERVPGDAIAWLVRGSIEVARGDAGAGEASLRRALALEPSNAEAWHYLGEALQRQERWREAIDAYRRAMAVQPAEIFNIAICAERAGDMPLALSGYREMCRRHPQRADCRARLAQAEAMMCLSGPEMATSRRLAERLLSPPPLAADDLPEAFPAIFLDLPEQARRVVLARQAGRHAGAAAGVVRAPPGPRRAGDRIRIGYLSPDFGPHAVGRLVDGLFRAHDRARVEVTGYSLKRHTGALAERLASSFDRFRQCGGDSDEAIASLIGGDRIDVLIDLGGPTQGARPGILARRPAPVQFGWLGFIHAQEAPWLDGILLDRYVQPRDAPWPYADRVVRLPGTLFPCGPLPRGTPDRTAFGFPADAFVLASFNNSYKLDEALIAAWTRILRRVPRARLVVYLPEHARAGFADTWHRHGGAPERVLAVDRLDVQGQADRAASCDLFLDAFRYQAGATALASVASGLPLLCREGSTPPQRLGVGINRFLGQDALVCADTEAYVERAVELAGSPATLAALRAAMLEAADARGLHDPRRAAAAIEDLCTTALQPSAILRG